MASLTFNNRNVRMFEEIVLPKSGYRAGIRGTINSVCPSGTPEQLLALHLGQELFCLCLGIGRAYAEL